MTLFKQIALLITGIFIILFIIGLSVSFTIIQQTAKKSLYENAQNSATSISLSINSLGANMGAVQTTVNAAFDNGNYEKIVFLDRDNQIKFIREKTKKEAVVPVWFESLIVNMDSISAKANISEGWAVIGTMEVYSDLEAVYIQLYEIFQTLLGYLGLCFFFALGVISFFFHILLRPLKKIQQQAQSIIENEFIVQENLPKTYEFHSVTQSMNTMVLKVEQIFNSANESLKQNKELLYIDSSTRLHNRRYFTLKAGEYISDNSSFSEGIIVVIGVSRVDLLNKIVGYQKTDEFLKNIAIEMCNSFQKYPASLLCRLNGTEFVVMIPSDNLGGFQGVIDDFSHTLKKEFQILKKDETQIELNIGITNYYNEKNIAQLFAKIDNSLTNAKFSSSTNIIQNCVITMGKEQWREMLSIAIEKEEFEVKYNNVINGTNGIVLYHDLDICLHHNKTTYAYSEFIAAVIELGMLGSVYIAIIKQLLAQKNDDIPVLISLPFHLIECTHSYQTIKTILEFSNKNRRNIIFEIPEDAINKRYDCITQIINLIKENGYNFAVSNFIANSDDYNFLKEWKPKYIKMSKTFILDSSQNISLVRIIMESLGVEIVATDILNDIEIEKLQVLGVKAIKK